VFGNKNKKKDQNELIRMAQDSSHAIQKEAVDAEQDLDELGIQFFRGEEQLKKMKHLDDKRNGFEQEVVTAAEHMIELLEVKMKASQADHLDEAMSDALPNESEASKNQKADEDQKASEDQKADEDPGEAMEKLLRDARGEKVTDEFRSAVDRIPLFDSNLDVDATEEFIEKETSSVEEGNAISEKSTASTSLNLDFSVSYEYIKNMREKSHEMSALALQSAIEASRLGEDGTKYVASAQTMREAAESYDKEAELLKEELIRMESLIDQVKTMKETMESALEEMRTDANAIQESRKEIVIAREQYESLMNQLDATLSSGRDRCGTVQDRMHRMQDMTKEILDQE
jgi:hypothetical protein